VGLIAIALGHLVGGVVIALASAQGPQLGIPQMVQSRGQFGRYGALLIVFFTALIYVGFFISNIVLAGKTIHGIAPSVPMPGAIVIGALSATAIGVIGYRFIHILNRIGTWVMGSALLAGFIMMFAQDLPADFFSRGAFNLSGFIATVSLGTIWQISFSPYTSDYSRYLPREIGIAKPFWATYFGATLGTILCFSFGAVAVLCVPKAPTPWRGQAGHRLAGADPDGAVPAQHHQPQRPQPVRRGAVDRHRDPDLRRPVDAEHQGARDGVGDPGGCGVVALNASADFIGQFIGLILALLLVLVPWASINLIDFYLIKKGEYDIASIFSADGGIYGRFNHHAIIAYACGILVQLPFANTSLYVGPYSNIVEGADCRGCSACW
jgi:NCS1 family nucleobase:cation symporter-1